jgi:hypothetical protein
VEWLRHLGEGAGPILDLFRTLSDPSRLFALMMKALTSNPIGVVVLIASAIVAMMLLLLLVTAFYAARASRTASEMRRLQDAQDRLVSDVDDLRTAMTFVGPRLEELSVMMRILAQERPHQLPPGRPTDLVSRIRAALQVLFGR